MIFGGVAYAAEAFAQDAAGGAVQSFLGNPMILMIAMLAIFYFLLIRPQQRRQKEHKEMLANLQKGDTIFTAGGIHGKITGLSESTLTIEVADRVRIKINRSAVGGLISKGGEAAPKGETVAKSEAATEKETEKES